MARAGSPRPRASSATPRTPARTASATRRSCSSAGSLAPCVLGPAATIWPAASIPLLNGIDAAGQIVAACPDTQVVMLTALEQERLVTDAVRAGVRGFVLKTQAGEDLALAIEQVSRGGFYVGAGVSQAVVEACRAAAAADGGRLTSRERQVVQLVAEGKSTKQVAALLAITPKTAEFHRTRVMKKLNVHDVAGLVRYAIREGLIEP